ncbi:MAG: MFS transporter [Defluviitaleaceae bacterium]|nr:MFS transporter [Defluviitaleaceae bacterium]
MLGHLMAKGRTFIIRQPLSVRYGIDGILVTGGLSLAANNNNLFAQRLGAGDFHLAMLQFLPQIIMLFLLIPSGILADSLKNKRVMVVIALVCSGIFFALAGGAAFIPLHTIYFFLVFLAIANISNGMYNLSWQGYFPEVVSANPEAHENRNNVLTFRARMVMIVNFSVPLVVGVILTAITSHEGKVAAHQAFYGLAAVMYFSNAFHFRKIKATQSAIPKGISRTEMKEAVRRMVKNKPFMLFTLLILFFHMMWQADWTLYFIGQANYLYMNELMLSMGPVTATAAQLITLKFWSKNNVRQGVDKPLAYGMFSLALCPLAIIIGVSLPLSVGPWVFLVIHFIGHLGFANIALNLFQSLLKVVDEEYRSFFISVYTCVITLSNALMPVAGVAVYRAFGGNRQGLIYTFFIMFILRILVGILWLIRCKYANKPSTALPSEA